MTYQRDFKRLEQEFRHLSRLLSNIEDFRSRLNSAVCLGLAEVCQLLAEVCDARWVKVRPAEIIEEPSSEEI